MNNIELYKLLNEVLDSADKCYNAFSKLAFETRVTFNFYATDLYQAKRFITGWMQEIARNMTEEEVQKTKL